MKVTQPIPVKEKSVHQQVCNYLKLQYPEVIFTSDASGMRVSMGLRIELKRKRCARYVIPDLIILHPANGYHGLLIEIKKDASEWFNRHGEVKMNNKHIAEQCKTLDRLNELDYCALVGCGFDTCKNIIDNYLKTI